MKPIQIAILLAQAFILTGCGTGPESVADRRFRVPAGGYPVSVEDSGDPKVDGVVLRLVSKRPASYPSGSTATPIAVLGLNGYITPEVDAAIRELKAMGPVVFPALVQHRRDERYSYSGFVAAWINYSVRDVIVEVLCDDLRMHSGYKFRETPSGSRSYLDFEGYLNARGWEVWADWASSKSRVDIQMDFIDWCVAEEERRGFIDEQQRSQILGIYTMAREEVRRHYSQPLGEREGSQPIRPATGSRL